MESTLSDPGGMSRNQNAKVWSLGLFSTLIRVPVFATEIKTLFFFLVVVCLLLNHWLFICVSNSKAK